MNPLVVASTMHRTRRPFAATKKCERASRWYNLDASWDYATLPTNLRSIHNLFPNPDSATVRHLPDPKLWSRSIAAALLEVMSGRRPVQQLERWLDDRIFEALTRRVELNQRLSGKPPKTSAAKVLSSRVCVVNDHVIETTHSVFITGTTHAVCVRLEARRNQWLVTAIEAL
ncbi:hypothetical protein HMPREF0044_0842 [Gleimia coleocanis DSM 15436]|uniref:Uncharacterized protein n=1 Tax=Gleimia coleocanis DSM 15436 TaxID=525245 RepID=C0VZW4_9ACTO|nr:Rv3235 family protein [Gleimia coleocanis]EEH63823.1 hypothetical protein HMPREF0044_0842 [Gleimia coleocanis DSM 15436]